MTRSGAIWLTSIGSRFVSGLMMVATLILTTACVRGGTAQTAGNTAPSLAELSAATYREVFEEPVTLVDGRWEGSPYAEGGASRPSAGLIDHFVLTGDLDGDARNDTAVLLWKHTGGSGTRLYLAAVGRRDGKITNLGTALIGDRVQIRSGVIEDGRIILDLVRAGPSDAACCPTEKAQLTWVLSETGLSLDSDETTGSLSIADLEGPQWVLVELGRGQPVPAGTEITLRFVKDRAEGHTGCNSYFAGILATVPGEFEFNGMGTTRAACPEPAMELERTYLKALAEASTYSFLGGRLVLGCETADGHLGLAFARRATAVGNGFGNRVE